MGSGTTRRIRPRASDSESVWTDVEEDRHSDSPHENDPVQSSRDAWGSSRISDCKSLGYKDPPTFPGLGRVKSGRAGSPEHGRLVHPPSSGQRSRRRRVPSLFIREVKPPLKNESWITKDESG